MRSEHLQNWTRIGSMNMPNTYRHLWRFRNPLRGGHVYRTAATGTQSRPISCQFPAGKLAGNWATILWVSSSIDIATPKGVSEFSRSARPDSWGASTIAESRVVAMNRPSGLPLPWGEGGVRGKEPFDQPTVSAASPGSWVGKTSKI